MGWVYVDLLGWVCVDLPGWVCADELGGCVWGGAIPTQYLCWGLVSPLPLLVSLPQLATFNISIANSLHTANQEAMHH